MDRPGAIVKSQQRASQLMRRGQIPDAIAAYKALLAEAPDLAESWFNLAWLQRQNREFGDALLSYTEAILWGVSGPEEAHVNKAAILSADLGKTDEALIELNAALEKQPDYLPALLNLGNLHEDMGERENAQAAYDRALQVDPGNALTLARLAGVSVAGDLNDPLIETLRAALALPTLSPSGRSDLGFALGRILDGCGAYDEAFQVYSAANKACVDAFGSAFRPYDKRAAEKAISAVIEAFATPLKPLPGNRAEAFPAPVFICGMFRSGSTLTEQMLGRHAEVTPGGELDILPTLMAREWPDFPAGGEADDDAFLGRMRENYIADLMDRFDSGALITDKRPDNFVFVGLIKRLFPGARIINTTRNPCDNALSIYFQLLGPEFAYATRLEDIAHWYRQYQRLAGHWRKLYPRDFHDVDYDRLVSQPRQEVQALLTFLDLPFDDNCLAPEGSGAAVRTASVWQVRQPLYRHASGRWRNYSDHLTDINGVLGCT